MHIHVHASSGEAKFWMEPDVQLAQAHGLAAKEIAEAQRLVEEHQDEIRRSWHDHFTR